MKKLRIKELKIVSFITTLDESTVHTIKGGSVNFTCPWECKKETERFTCHTHAPTICIGT